MTKICFMCKKEFGIFRWRHKCTTCSNEFCSDCLKDVEELYGLSEQPVPPGKCCHFCFNTKARLMLERYEKCQSNYKNVQLYSVNYRGKLKNTSSNPPIEISTRFFRKKEDAEWALRIEALFLGCDFITNFELANGRASSTTLNGRGTYYYNEWRARGLGCRKSN